MLRVLVAEMRKDMEEKEKENGGKGGRRKMRELGAGGGTPRTWCPRGATIHALTWMMADDGRRRVQVR